MKLKEKTENKNKNSELDSLIDERKKHNENTNKVEMLTHHPSHKNENNS